MREAFSEALAQAKLGKPAVIFIDEIDVLCPRRDSRYVMSMRFKVSLLYPSNSSHLQAF